MQPLAPPLAKVRDAMAKKAQLALRGSSFLEDDDGDKFDDVHVGEENGEDSSMFCNWQCAIESERNNHSNSSLGAFLLAAIINTKRASMVESSTSMSF